MAQRSKPATKRIRSYNLKTDPEYIAHINTQQRKAMEAKHAQMQNDLQDIETRAKEMLDGIGVFGIPYVSYLNFVRECWKLKRKHTGEGAAKAAAVLMLKWHARGLDNDIMKRLRFELFSIPDPKTPLP